MLGSACKFRKDHFSIMHPELEGWLHRQVPHLKDKLFVYKAHRWGTYVIGFWVARDWFVDVLNLGTSLSHFTRPVATALISQLQNPVTVQETISRLKGSDSDGIRSLQDNNDSIRERNDWRGVVAP